MHCSHTSRFDYGLDGQNISVELIVQNCRMEQKGNTWSVSESFLQSLVDTLKIAPHQRYCTAQRISVSNKHNAFTRSQDFCLRALVCHKNCRSYNRVVTAKSTAGTARG